MTAQANERRLAAERLGVIQGLTARLSRGLREQEVAELTLLHGLEVLGAEAGNVYALAGDRSNGLLRLTAYRGYDPSAVESFRTVPIGAPVPNAIAVRTGQSIWLESADDWRRLDPDSWAVAAGLQAAASLPLRVGSEVLGVVGLSFDGPRQFSDEDRAFMEAVAEQCALAVERGRLIDRTERLQALTSALSGALTPRDVADVLLKQGLRALGADAGAVYLLDPDEHEPVLRAVAFEGYPGDNLGAFERISLASGFAVAAAAAGEPVWLASREEWMRAFPVAGTVHTAMGLEAAAALPLRVGQRSFGAVRLSLRGPHGFSPDERAFISAVVDQCSQALERALLHERVERERSLLDAVVRQAPVGVVITEAPTGRALFFNQAAEQMLGPAVLPSSAVAEGGWYSGEHPDGTPLAPEEYPTARALRHGQPIVEQELSYRRPDGEVASLSVSASPIRDGEGRTTAVVTIVTDVTERRRAEAERERLLASEREARAAAEVTARRADALAAETAALVRHKDEFVASVSHDLQQPMTAILGFVRLLLRQVRRGETVSPERLESLLSNVEKTGARMSGQVQELLDAAQIERGRPLELRLGPADLVELAGQVVEELRGSAGRQELAVEALEATLLAQVDARRVRRALANLISNAIKYSPDGSEVLVRVGRDPAAPGGRALVEVRDQGIGIPAADLPRLFERFFRARNAVDQAVGTGLGLAGARAIVEQHGGTIEVESQEGLGSTFRVRLPLAAASPSGGER